MLKHMLANLSECHYIVMLAELLHTGAKGVKPKPARSLNRLDRAIIAESGTKSLHNL